MFCKKCGAELKDTAKFCNKCGAQVTAKAEASKKEAPKKQAQAKPSKPAGDKPKSRKGLIIGLSIGVGVLVIAIAVICYLLLTGKGPTLKKNSNANAEQINLEISQVDASAFPNVTLYLNMKDSSDSYLNSTDPSWLKIVESDEWDNQYEADCTSITKLNAGDSLNVNLVVDHSASMSSNKKINSAKSAANSFIDKLAGNSSTSIELTSFNSKVFNAQPFTNNAVLLHSAVNSLDTDGDTALYDSLYWALQRTNLKNGSRFVIAFTDGEENASKYGRSDVISLSERTGIPVYIIGVGSSVDQGSLRSLAESCKGSYFDCGETDMSSTLSKIYNDIYNEQTKMVKATFTSNYPDNKTEKRYVSVVCADGSQYSGDATVSYVPEGNVSSFDNFAVSGDYVLPDSDSRYYTEAELSNMSIWDLYLARNEIYARHGRDFKHKDLQEYFATKTWYHKQYSPSEFDAMQSRVFNDFERKNADLMLKIEKGKNSPYLAP